MNRRSLFKALLATPVAAAVAAARPKPRELVPVVKHVAHDAYVCEMGDPSEGRTIDDVLREEAGKTNNDLLERIYKQMQESAQDVWIDRHRQAYYALHTPPNLT